MDNQLRILTVGDSEDDYTLLLRELRRTGYNHVSSIRVETPEEMAVALDGEAWEVVTADCYMPFFNATDALALLQRKGLDVPFIVVSGRIGEDVAVAIMKAGAHDYVMKDNLIRLGAVIERELREAHNRREKKRAEERYRSIFENSAEGIFQTTVEGRLEMANPALARIFGYASPGEMISCVTDVATQIYADPGTREEFIARVRRQGSMSGFEARANRKDGSGIWISWSARAMLDAAGDLVGFEGAVEDITERKKAEKLLRQSEERHRAVVEQAAECIFLVDPNTKRVLESNAALQTLLGYTSEESLRRSLEGLLALREAGQILGSTLEAEEIGATLLRVARRVFSLRAAVISKEDDRGLIRVWHAVGLGDLWPRTRYVPEAEAARRVVLETGERRTLRLRPPGPGVGRLSAFFLPLRARDRTISVLEAYGPGTLAEERTVAVLESLAGQAVSALENVRLYSELAEREKRLEDLVGRLFVAQDEERRRVAYEIHDGLAQTAAAHQYLQAFDPFHPPGFGKGREILDQALELVRSTVGEARRVIANLRPTALDDFGLQTAIRLEIEALREEGWQAVYEANLKDDERLPAAVETALFRITQEALTNVRKHANTKRLHVSLVGHERGVYLNVRDWGRGFDPAAVPNAGGPGERVGLVGMRERVFLLGGDLQVHSSPGDGALIRIYVPVPQEAVDSGRTNFG